ncbi:NTP transferase domain-containing protein [Epibacterium sp. SM1979]|uniref:NTP transferase domain-containing protein n=1 Tax=Tritonibacter litoralis TaxID=2662264 RepID=A0A843YC89_9RHOB|nr:nucleotidyltransferase family protein [Tritonibacter litoralis]MQQ07285.1 NTP transferase domain-containing protein [Tritonibacter litoralis]
MSGIAVLILAAGRSARMRGGDKMFEQVQGQPLLTCICARAAATGLDVLVTLPDLDHPRVGLIDAAKPVPVPDASEGMSASIRRGVAALPDATRAVMILPGDMPEVETSDLLSVAAAFDPDQENIARAAAADGRPGHPVLFPKRLFPQLTRLHGDHGARSVLKSEPVTPVPLPGQRALVDLDTPEAWAHWRASLDP